MAILLIDWSRYGIAWHSLEHLDLEKIGDVSGVYVIWHEGSNPRYIRIGSGKIKDRISEHRNNPKITKYAERGPLYVTWASVEAYQQEGVEAFLAQACNPLEGERFPDRTPLEVNTPPNGVICLPVNPQAVQSRR